MLTQHYGDAYYHFVVENMSRLTVVLDVLLENPDIKVSFVMEVLLNRPYHFVRLGTSPLSLSPHV